MTNLSYSSLHPHTVCLSSATIPSASFEWQQLFLCNSECKCFELHGFFFGLTTCAVLNFLGAWVVVSGSDDRESASHSTCRDRGRSRNSDWSWPENQWWTFWRTTSSEIHSELWHGTYAEWSDICLLVHISSHVPHRCWIVTKVQCHTYNITPCMLLKFHQFVCWFLHSEVVVTINSIYWDRSVTVISSCCSYLSTFFVFFCAYVECCLSSHPWLIYFLHFREDYGRWQLVLWVCFWVVCLGIF